MNGAGQRETITDSELFIFAQSLLWSVNQLRTGKNETRSACYEVCVYKKEKNNVVGGNEQLTELN